MTPKDISQEYNLTSVNGSVLTLKGLISIGVNVNFEANEALVTVVSPVDTVGRVGIPKVGFSISKIMLDDALVVYQVDSRILSSFFLSPFVDSLTFLRNSER